MIIDLNDEEWEFLQRMVTRCVLLNSKNLIINNFAKDSDLLKCESLLKKLNNIPVDINDTTN